jgi:hypothetical protein
LWASLHFPAIGALGHRRLLLRPQERTISHGLVEMPFGGDNGERENMVWWRFVKAGPGSTEKTGPVGGEFSCGLKARRKAISAAWEFSGPQLTNWGESGEMKRAEGIP